jgi:hypothetical protein
MKVAELVAELGLELDGGQFAAGTKAIEQIANALKALALWKGVMVFKNWIMETANVADAAKKMGERWAVTTEAVQELDYAAKANDTSFSELAQGALRAERRLDGVGKKTDGAAKALRGLGLTAKEFKALALDEKIERLADGFKGLGDKEASDLAQKLGLGKGPLLMLKSGSEGIRELREEARLLGLVIDDATAAAFEEWNDDIARVKGAITGLKNDAVVAMLPVLHEVTKGLFAWIKANRELMKTRLEQFLRLVVDLAKGLVKVAGTVYELFLKIAPVIDNVAGAFANLLAIGNEAGAELQAVAVGVAAAWALANLPIILLIGLMAAAILIVDDLWSGFQGGDSVLGELLEAATKTLGESGIGRLALGVKAAFQAVFDFIAEKIEWLMEQGRKISEFADKFLNGDTQFQTDQAAAGTAEALRLKRRREMQATGLTNEYQLERLGLGRSTQVGIDKVVQDQGVQVRRMADTGIDEIRQAPMLSLVDKIPKVDRGPSIFDHMQRGLIAPVNVAAPQMRLEVNITGRTDGEDLSETIVTRMQEFWDTSIRDAQIAAGGRGGRLP